MVIGINMGIGSGLGDTLIGAADNLTIGFVGGTPTTYNFEATAVPEPSTIALSMSAGLCGLLYFGRQRRRRNASA